MSDNSATERLRQVRELFDVALELAPETRAAFLVAATLEDPSLRAEVERLLRALDRAGDELDAGASSLLARAIAEGDARVRQARRHERPLDRGGSEP